MLDQTEQRLRRQLRRLYVKVATTCYRRVDIYARDLEGIPSRQLDPEFEVRLLELRDLPAYQAMRPGRPPAEALARFAAGDSCMGVWHGARIVHAGWIATKRVHIPYLQRDLILRPADIYSHDTYTLPSYRARGLGSAKGAYVFRHYRGLGFRRSVVIVATENELGAGQVRTLGYRVIGRYSFVRLGSIHRALQPFPEDAGQLR